MYRGQTLQIRGMYRGQNITSKKNVQGTDILTQNWFSVQVFIEPVYSTCTGMEFNQQ